MKVSVLFQIALVSLVSATRNCDSSSLNKTVGTYYVKDGESIAHISRITNRGICDIARLNRMADAMLPLTIDEELIIPPEVCQPDNSTCLITHHPESTAQGDFSDVDAEVQVGNFLKLPQCSPSTCSFHPKTFTYGTFKDIADKVNTTPGQIMGLNPTYNHTDVGRGEGAVMTLPHSCELTGSKITVIS
ncbi:uncharacterized protein N7483_004690 [Penicillium malachiteum]|uniref:uncharacterized protein n=1 Tax=Penicillium malachiteum TaxID=1324776 RepID=UPI00254962FD|nr:uncharacterized protein N7483_004690 [Penicillium malachiteum]KAJ5730182.1 hypothetical protein N7483_004690 [Penicillium malachiteum]